MKAGPWRRMLSVVDWQ